MRCRKAHWYLSARCDGTLSERQRARLEDHLAGCESCRREAFYFSEIASLTGHTEVHPVRPDFNLRLRAAVRRAENAPPLTWKSRLTPLLWRPALVTTSLAAIGFAGLGAYNMVVGDEADPVVTESSQTTFDPQYGIAVPAGKAISPGVLTPVDEYGPEAARYQEARQFPHDFVTETVRLEDTNRQNGNHFYVMPTMTQDQVLKKESY